MRRRIGSALAALALAASGGAVAGTLPGAPAHAQQVAGFDFSSPEVMATDLRIPWGMDFLPDGTALIAERNTGRVLRINPGGGGAQPVTTLPGVDSVGEGGALGLALGPADQVYVYITTASDNRIVRFSLDNPQNVQPVFTGIPRGTTIHNGGRIAFGPDGMLYVATGDAANPDLSQDTGSLAGKILRMTPEGGVPAGNPFGDSVVYAYGLRNVQGLAWDSQGRLYANEFGDTDWDEVNRIEAGGNYGWPIVEGIGNDPRFIEPLLVWRPAEASPSGMASTGDTLFTAALRGSRLWTIPLDGQGGVGQPTAVLQGDYGRIRTVEIAPDGALWITTSNHDTWATPRPNDDQVIRFPSLQQPPTPGPTTPPVDPTTPPVDPTTPPVDPTTPPATGGCTASYQVTGEWGGGFQGEVTVTNPGSQPLSDWTVTWSFPDGQSIDQLWNGDLSQSGANVTVRPLDWNRTVPAGGSVGFGFLGSWSGNNGVPASVSCSGG